MTSRRSLPVPHPLMRGCSTVLAPGFDTALAVVSNTDSGGRAARGGGLVPGVAECSDVHSAGTDELGL